MARNWRLVLSGNGPVGDGTNNDMDALSRSLVDLLTGSGQSVKAATLQISAEKEQSVNLLATDGRKAEPTPLPSASSLVAPTPPVPPEPPVDPVPPLPGKAPVAPVGGSQFSAPLRDDANEDAPVVTVGA